MLVFDQTVFVEIGFLEIDECKDTGHQPAGRVCHANGNDRIGNEVCHDIQIDLTKEDEGTEQNDHGRTTVAGSAQST